MILGIDLGGTKMATALFTDSGELVKKESQPLAGRVGRDVGALITEAISVELALAPTPVSAIGVSVPGISRAATGTVWAPNIPGWDDYPLMEEIEHIAGSLAVRIDSDRACGVLGELWQGNARGCKDVIYLAVGTGIGAGVLIDGRVLRGSQDIAGSVGWMALDKPFQDKYVPCGCFEYYASGHGMAKLAREMLDGDRAYTGVLRDAATNLTAHHIFDAYDQGDALATAVVNECVHYWGMGVANLISIFNPEKIIFGGGVFGPALKFLKNIHGEACKWAQPVSMKHVTFEASGLRGDAAIFGAAFLALDSQRSREST